MFCIPLRRHPSALLKSTSITSSTLLSCRKYTSPTRHRQSAAAALLTPCRQDAEPDGDDGDHSRSGGGPSKKRRHQDVDDNIYKHMNASDVTDIYLVRRFLTLPPLPTGNLAVAVRRDILAAQDVELLSKDPNYKPIIVGRNMAQARAIAVRDKSIAESKALLHKMQMEIKQLKADIKLHKSEAGKALDVQKSATQDVKMENRKLKYRFEKIISTAAEIQKSEGAIRELEGQFGQMKDAAANCEDLLTGVEQFMGTHELAGGAADGIESAKKGWNQAITGVTSQPTTIVSSDKVIRQSYEEDMQTLTEQMRSEIAELKSRARLAESAHQAALQVADAHIKKLQDRVHLATTRLQPGTKHTKQATCVSDVGVHKAGAENKEQPESQIILQPEMKVQRQPTLPSAMGTSTDTAFVKSIDAAMQTPPSHIVQHPVSSDSETQVTSGVSTAVPLPLPSTSKPAGQWTKKDLAELASLVQSGLGLESLAEAIPSRKLSSIQNQLNSTAFKNRLAKLLDPPPPKTKIPKSCKHAKNVKPVTGVPFDKTRVNITSEKLCDDVINRMAPSLTKHIGCDIIDINPGNGLWSSKIHKFLQPRTHILMEPNYKAYSDSLDPLLNAKDSAYKLIPKSGITWAHLERAMSPENLPNQPLLQRGDERLHKPNDTLLLIANLAWNPQKAYRGFKSITQLIMHQLASALKSHSLVHQYGMVRMLLWIPHADKKAVLTEGAFRRKQASIEAEILCDIHDIADTLPVPSNHRLTTRESHLIMESSQLALRRMQEAGIKIPVSRQDPSQIEAAEASNLEQVVHEFQPQDVVGESAEHGSNPRRSLRGKTRGNVADQARAFVSEHDAIVQDMRELKSASVTVEEQHQQQESINERLSTWLDEVDGLRDNVQRMIWQSIENHRVLRQTPPVTMWDRRESEPLKLERNEVEPKGDVCLLDYRPKPMWPILRDDPAAWEQLEFILHSFFVNTQDLETSLLRLPPGAHEWIVPRCPSLTDLENGGGLNLKTISPKGLNETMLKEILTAWMSWPFRPSRWELMRTTGVDFEGDFDNITGKAEGLS